jgi:metal-responsive CopG/Arc/MetJ family transcriptional regulator
MIRMEKDLRDRIDAAAKSDGMGRSAWIRYACIQRLECQNR